jgi:hypothetical protein
MAVDLLTPSRIYVPTVSRPLGSGSTATLTGRWAKIDANGLVQAPGAQYLGLYLIIEGRYLHNGSPTEFAGTAPYASTNYGEFPAFLGSPQVALWCGVIRVKIGCEGFDVSDSAAIVAGAKLTPDAYGRLVATGATDANCIAVVESVNKDGSNNVVDVTIRTLGK